MPKASPAAGEPIKIGIIADESTLEGAAAPKAAQMAVDIINAKGGVMGRPIVLVVYDSHLSSTVAIQAFQRLATQDKAVVAIHAFVSEVALALEPWSARLKMPFIDSGAAADKISAEVHADYDKFKYTFHGWMPSTLQAELVANSAHDLLVERLHMSTAVVMSENAAWTIPLDAGYLKYLPPAGLKVLDHIRFDPDTTDFTPIYSKIERLKPNTMVIGIAHVGVVPTVQWWQAKVPVAMYGINSQASSSAFWRDTHGAAESQTGLVGAAPDSEITPQTLPFTNAYDKRYGLLPAYPGYSTYDLLFIIAAAIERVRSTDGAKLVTGLEATDYVGTIGRWAFYGRESPFTHAMKVGPNFIPGIMEQWQAGKIKTIWPLKYATAKIVFPSFVKLPGSRT